MKQSHYTLLIVLLTAIATFIPFFAKRKLFDWRFKKKWFKSVSCAGYCLIAVTVSIIVVSFMKDDAAEVEDNRKSFIADSTIKALDSIADIKSESRHQATISNFGDAIGKYGLMYSETEQKIKKLIRDSANVKKYYERDPDLQVYSIKETRSTKDSVFFDIKFVSNHQTSQHVNLVFCSIIQAYKLNIFHQPTKLLRDVTIPVNDSSTKSLFLTEHRNANLIYFLIKGTYKNQQKKPIEFKDVFLVNRNKKELYEVEDPDRKTVIDLAKSQGFIF